MNVTSSLLVTLLLFCIGSSPALAAEDPVYKQGLAAARKGDYSTAIKVWMPLAQQGHAETQYRLGSLYRLGLGVKKNPEEAFKWFSRAAEQNHAKATYNLAVLYELGVGTPANDLKAKELYALAAQKKVEIANKRLQPQSSRASNEPAAPAPAMAPSAVIDVKEKNPDIHEALRAQARRGDIASMRLLLKAGADVNRADKYARTALMEAALAGRVSAVQLLLNSGAQVNARDSYKNTPLILAAMKNHSEVVRELLRNGAQLELKDKTGTSALSIAVMNGQGKAYRNY